MACFAIHAGAQTPSISGAESGTLVQGQLTPVDPDRNADGTYKSMPGMKAPRLIRSEDPKYTKSARKQRLTGVVVVALIVDENGLPQNVHVQQATNTELDEMAIVAISKYRFKPAIKDGKAVPVDLSVTVNFRL